MNIEIQNLYDRIEFLDKKIHWLEKENELLTIQKERAVKEENIAQDQALSANWGRGKAACARRGAKTTSLERKARATRVEWRGRGGKIADLKLGPQYPKCQQIHMG